jgi:DNA-binding LacI/PurR family transcriptional regulator
MPSKPTSIKEIAKIAGVSHSSVSRALRNSPLVNRDKADRIRRIAEECGYRPSAAARSLVTRRSQTIGVVVTSIADPFVAGVVSGIEDIANERGFSVFLANSGVDPAREIRVVHAFEERRVDGIIVTASRVGALYVPVLEQMQVPIVLLNNQHPSQFAHSVMIANVEASREATRHLVSLGHRRIAYIGDRLGFQSDTERLDGFRSALDEAGIPLDPALVVHGDGKPEAAREAMAQLLALQNQPTAVFCYNDLTALGAFRQIADAGLRVPHDISLVGFDDLYISLYLEPPLTTVRQPMRQMGNLAMTTLLRLIAGEGLCQDIKVPGELIVRRSTAPPKENS